VGRIVVDDPLEVGYLANLVRRQRVLIQVIPDVDIHGHCGAGISDQKFGFTVGGDHAAHAVRWVLAHRTLELVGLHCRISSEVIDPAEYGEAIRRVIAVMADVRNHHGVILTELSLGGVSCRDARKLAAVIEDALDDGCAAEHFPRPAVVVEVPAGDYQGIVAQE
jgi:diaminopimelate decarboxylase